MPKLGCGDLCGLHFQQQRKDGWHGRVDGPIPEGKLKVFKEKNAGKAPRAAPAAEAGAAGEGAGVRAEAGSAGVPASDGTAAPAADGAAGGAGGASAPSAASEPSSGGEHGGRGRSASAREIAAAAAEDRARREDPEERRQRLALAEHNKRQNLLGEVIGAYAAHGQTPDFSIGTWSDEKLRQTLRRLRGGEDDVMSEPTIVALSEAAL